MVGGGILVFYKAEAVGNYAFSWPLAKTKTAIDRIFSVVTTMRL